MTGPLIFDTLALMTLWNNDPGAEKIQNFFKEIDENQREGYISVITLSEVFYLTYRRLGTDQADNLIEQLLHSSLQIIPISVEIAISAGKIKKTDISLSDTLIAASALFLNATVISGDSHFQFLGVNLISYP